MKLYSSGRFRGGAFVLASLLSAPAAGQSAGAPGSHEVLLNLKNGVWVGQPGGDGFLDEPLVFRGDTADQVLRIRISQARTGDGAERVPLYLAKGGDNALLDASQIVKAQAGRAEQKLFIPGGKTSSVRLVGGPFQYADKTYRARLVVEPEVPAGKEGQEYLYPVLIDPLVPLGLQAAELEVEREILPWRTAWFEECIPTEHTGPVRTRLRLRPPATPVEGARTLPAGKVSVAALGTEECGLRVSFLDLSQDQYLSLLNVNGEDLRVKLTLKHPWWVVPILIFLGAMLSLGIRELLGYFQRRFEAQNRITRIKAELEQRERLIAWDDLRAHNALRHAEGVLGLLDLPELAAALEDAERKPSGWAEIASIRAALVDGPPLPRDVRNQVECTLRGIMRISSAPEARRVADLLGALKRRADNGFRSDVLIWMDRLRSDTAVRKPALLAAVAGVPIEALLSRAVEVLESLIEDADYLLVNNVALAPEQIAVLEAIPGTLAELQSGLEQGRLSREQLMKVLFCELSSTHIPLIQPPALPAGLQVDIKITEPADQVTCALQPITFELSFTPPLNPAQPDFLEVDWEVNGKRIEQGGLRLTYLFSGKRSKAAPEVKATVRLPGDAQGAFQPRWSKPLMKRPSPSRQPALHLFITRKAATLVAVAVTSVIAIALYWSGKPFGRLTDYVSLLGIGLGADAALVAGGGALLAKVLGSFGLAKPEGAA